MQSSGLQDAPVTQYWLLGLVVVSSLASITASGHLFYFRVEFHRLHYDDLWRLIAWQLCYDNPIELIAGAALIYRLRVVERLQGSSKYTLSLLSALPYALTIPPLILILAHLCLLPESMYLPTGPTTLLFTILVQYYTAVPPVSRYCFSESRDPIHSALTFSDKFTTYIIAAQLALSQFPSSILPALVGWVIGAAYRAEILPVVWRRVLSNSGGAEAVVERRARKIAAVGDTPTSQGANGLEGMDGVRRRA